MQKIKIFMCAHKSFELLPPLTVAVQGGAVLNETISGAIPDFGSGGSISEMNPDYCELTVQYYALKNEDADYYGFCHYRRFFSFCDKAKTPYTVLGAPKSGNIKKIIFDEERMREVIESCDVLLPKSEDMGYDVYTQYESVAGCKRDDLLLFEELICKRFPYLSQYAKEYLCGRRQYFCNMFVMKKEIFLDYSERLFATLSEFDRLSKPNGELRRDRVDGYLAERFLGIYALYLKSNGKNVKEVSRVDVGCSAKKILLHKLFPPETKRRFWAKKILKSRG